MDGAGGRVGGARGSGRAAKRPDALHETLWAAIRESIRLEIDETLPVMGTVQGGEGGRVRVHLDDEDDARELGFPKKAGQRYKPGDRVLAGKTSAGEHVILGTITSAEGSGQNVVGDDDMLDNAIDRRAVKNNAINGDKIEGGSVKTNHIDANQVTSSRLDQGVRDDLGKARSALQDVPTTYAKKTDIRNEALGSQALATESWADGRFLRSIPGSVATDVEVQNKIDALKKYVDDNFVKR